MKRTKLGGVTFNWREDLPLAMEELAKIGYEGFEILFQSKLYQPYRGKPGQLKKEISKAGIELAGLYFGGVWYQKETRDGEVKRALEAAQGLATLEGKYLIVGPSSRKKDSLGLTDQEYKHMTEALNQIGQGCQKLGITCSFHPHINLSIERRHEIDKIFSLTDPDIVKFCLDTGHIYAGGWDPVEVIEKYKERIVYVHLKDFKDGFYCSLGSGEIDTEAILKALKNQGYSGWILPEIPSRDQSAVGIARENYQYLKARLW